MIECVSAIKVDTHFYFASTLFFSSTSLEK